MLENYHCLSQQAPWLSGLGFPLKSLFVLFQTLSLFEDTQNAISLSESLFRRNLETSLE